MRPILQLFHVFSYRRIIVGNGDILIPRVVLAHYLDVTSCCLFSARIRPVILDIMVETKASDQGTSSKERMQTPLCTMQICRWVNITFICENHTESEWACNEGKGTKLRFAYVYVLGRWRAIKRTEKNQEGDALTEIVVVFAFERRCANLAELSGNL